METRNRNPELGTRNLQFLNPRRYLVVQACDQDDSKAVDLLGINIQRFFQESLPGGIQGWPWGD